MAHLVAAVVRLASRVMLEGLHVEMRRRPVMVAPLVSEIVALRTTFENIASWGVYSWEDGHPELRVLQLRNSDEPGCEDVDPEGLVAMPAVAFE